MVNKNYYKLLRRTRRSFPSDKPRYSRHICICTTWGKNTSTNYFSNNFVKPQSIL